MPEEGVESLGVGNKGICRILGLLHGYWNPTPVLITAQALLISELFAS